MSVKTFTAIKYAAGFVILAGCLVVNAGCAALVADIINEFSKRGKEKLFTEFDKIPSVSYPQESPPPPNDKPIDPNPGAKRSAENFQAPPKKNAIAKVKIKSARAEIKEKPSHKSKSIASLNKGEEAEKLDQEKSWLKVRYTANFPEVEGWILKCHCDGYRKCPSPSPKKKPEANKNLSPI
jgi:hypothetical protein